MTHWRSIRGLLATTALATLLASSGAIAGGPTGEQVVGGTATVARPGPNATIINQGSQRAIIDWQRFGIDPNHAVTFQQPGRNAVILNRVVGGEASRILGTLNANGNVMLVNPDGILFGPHSRIDVGGLVATTHDITNENFMAGRYIFDQPGNPAASIINEGLITAREGGVAALVAPGVRNSGVITARLGQVGLSAANGFTLDLYGDQLIQLRVDDEIVDQVIDLATGQPMSALVDNQGTISADGGTIALTAATARRVVDHVINNDGVLEANTVGMQNGRIVLAAQTNATHTPQAPAQNVRVSGTIRAAGQQSGQTGGEIHIVGEMIGLTRATLDASGDAGGGIVLVGGGFQGRTPSDAAIARYGIPLAAQGLPTATDVTVDRQSVIDASALTNGDGGTIVAWADRDMEFAGLVRSRGGALSGDGGFAEVSGLERLMFADIGVDLTAPNGRNGTILFDPEHMIVDRAHADALQNLLNTDQNADVVGDRITVAADILKTRGLRATLGLFANDGVTFNRGITIGSSSGTLNVFVDADFDNDGGASFLPAAMEAYARDLAALVAQIVADPVAFRLSRGLLTEQAAIDYINNIWPDTETLTFTETAERLHGLGYITDAQLEAARNSIFIDNGAHLFLNGGSLEVQDGSGVVDITGSTVGTFTDPTTGEQLFGPFILDADVLPNAPTRVGSPSGLPGAKVIDIRGNLPNDIPVSFSQFDFIAITRLAAQFGLDVNEAWRLARQTGYLLVDQSGVSAVSEQDGMNRATDRLIELYANRPDAELSAIPSDRFENSATSQPNDTRSFVTSNQLQELIETRQDQVIPPLEVLNLVASLFQRVPTSFNDATTWLLGETVVQTAAEAGGITLSDFASSVNERAERFPDSPWNPNSAARRARALEEQGLGVFDVE